MSIIENAFIDACKSDLITAEEAAKGISDAARKTFDKVDREINMDDKDKCAKKIWNLLKGFIPVDKADHWSFFVNNLDSTPKCKLEWYDEHDKATVLKKLSEEKPSDSNLALPIQRAIDEIVAFNKSMITKCNYIDFTYTIQPNDKTKMVYSSCLGYKGE